MQMMQEGSGRYYIDFPGLPPFIVTSTWAGNGGHIVAFQGFAPAASNLEPAFHALSLVGEKTDRSASKLIWVFQGTCRVAQSAASRPREHAGLVKRHDQCVTLIKRYASTASLKVENSFLEPRAGYFDTVVVFA